MASRKITHDWRQPRTAVEGGEGEVDEAREAEEGEAAEDGEGSEGESGDEAAGGAGERDGDDDGVGQVAGARQRQQRRLRKREEGKRLMRAVLGREGWELFELDVAGEEWVALTPPARDDLCAFREVLWRKYQRKRVPYRHIEILDKMLG